MAAVAPVPPYDLGRMKIFLSYASEDRPLAEEIQLALAGAGHEVFFDRESLPAGGDYHARIKASVGDADLFVFLISPDSVAAGGYALTEMGYARSRWPHPKGRVLPVVVRKTDFAAIPAYLKSVTVLEPSGNAAAEVVSAAARLADTPEATPNKRKSLLAGAAAAVLVAGGVIYMFLPPGQSLVAKFLSRIALILPVAGVSSEEPSGVLPPVSISRPSASQAEVLQKLLTRAASNEVTWLAATKPSDGSQKS